MMRNIVVFLVLVPAFLLVACGGRPDGPKTREDLSKAVFAALKAADAGAFVKLGATEDDVEDLWDMMAANVREAEREMEKRRQKRSEKETTEKLQKKMRESFERALDDCKGVVRIEEAEWVDVYRERDEESWGIKRKDFYFRVRQGDKLWCFMLNNCVFLNDRWVMTGGVRFRGEYKD